jgi:surfeit locus 1 family protein
MHFGKISYVILFAVVFVALIGLGFWQYSRYQQKTDWLKNLEKTKHQPALTHRDLSGHQWQVFRQLKLRGSFKIEESFLLSGELRHGRSGYSVVTPLEWAPNQPWVLVDRGWAPSPDGRDLPALKAPLAKDWIVGRIYSPVGKRYTLGPWQLAAKPGVVVVQDWDFAQIAQLLKHPVLPFVLRLSRELPGHYEREWSWIASIPPSRHLAYAIQWWMFALVGLIGVAILFKRTH